MKPEAQRIAIAEACGVKCAGCNNTGVRTKFGQDQYRRIRQSNPVWAKWPEKEPDIECHHNELPDYLNDRTAMHEAFLSLSDFHKVDCLGWLYGAARQNHHDKDVALAMATLPQWSFSILNTLGKWIDSTPTPP